MHSYVLNVVLFSVLTVGVGASHVSFTSSCPEDLPNAHIAFVQRHAALLLGQDLSVTNHTPMQTPIMEDVTEKCGSHCTDDVDCSHGSGSCNMCKGHKCTEEVTAAEGFNPKHCHGHTSSAGGGSPGYLMIGDSMVFNVFSFVKNRLSQNHTLNPVRLVTGTAGGAGDTDMGLACMPSWLPHSGFSVMSWNFGLHDIEDSEVFTPINDYKKNLKELAQLLKQHFHKQFYVTTTPVPNGHTNPPRDESKVIQYNSAAKGIMSSHGIPVLDAFRLITNECGSHYSSCKLQLHNNVHLSPDGNKLFAEAIASAAEHLHYGGACPKILNGIYSGCR